MARRVRFLAVFGLLPGAAVADEACVSTEAVAEAVDARVDAATAAAVTVDVSEPVTACADHPAAPAHYHLSARLHDRALLAATPLPVPPRAECRQQVESAADLVEVALDARPAPGPAARREAVWLALSGGGGGAFGGTALDVALAPEPRARATVAARLVLGPWSLALLGAPDLAGWRGVDVDGRTLRLRRLELAAGGAAGRSVPLGAASLVVEARGGARWVWTAETAALEPNQPDGTWLSTALTPWAGLAARVHEPRLPVFVELAVDAVPPLRLGPEPLYREPAVRIVVGFGLQARVSARTTTPAARDQNRGLAR